MFQTIKKSISLKLIFSIVATTVIIHLLYVAFQYQIEKKNFQQELDLKIGHYLEIVEITLQEPLWNLESSQVDDVLTSIIKDKEVYGIFVYDDRFNLINYKLRERDRVFNREYHSVKKSAGINKNLIMKETRVVSYVKNNEELVIGNIIVFFDTTIFKDRMFKKLLSLFFTILLLTLSIILTLYLLIKRIVIHPLTYLLESTDKVFHSDEIRKKVNHSRGGHHRLSLKKIKVYSEDEFGQLLNSFNHMLNRLNRSFSESERQNEFLNKITNSLTHPFYVIDARNYSIKLVNDASIDPLVDGSYKYIKDLNLDYITIVKKIKKSKRNIILECSYTKDDGVLYLEIYGFPIFNSKRKVTQAIIYYLDVTERHKAVKELEFTKNYLDNVIDSISSILITIDSSGSVTQWNREAEKVTNIRAVEALSSNIWECAPFLKDYEKDVSSVLSSNKPLMLYKEQVFIKDQELFYNFYFYPFEYEGSKGVVIRIENITDIIKKDEQLLQMQKMDTVGILAGGIAHDFNNVLTGITATVSSLKYMLQKDGMERDKVEYNVSIIDEAGKKATELVQRLLNLSRKGTSSYKMVDINDSIGSVIKICKNSFNKSINIISSYYHFPAITRADAGQLEQILLNMCVNSAHAMTIMRKEGDKQGGTLNISVDKVGLDKIKTNLPAEFQASDYWLIRISDTGVGIKPEDRSKIFDPFYTTKERGKGTGLGLSMVYNIVKQHSGHVNLYSVPGKGTTFSIYLPIYDIGGITSYNKSDRKKIPRGSGLVMLVDDESIIRKIAKSILEECGYDVILAEDGMEAIEKFKENKDKLKFVILDMEMPRLSGKEAFIKMKSLDPDVKVLLASGFKQDERVQEILKLGVKGFIHKPYTVDTLMSSIKKILK